MIPGAERMSFATSSGYTLIELVVALAILSLTSVLIVEGVRLGTHAWMSVNAKLARADAVSVAQHALRSLLERAYPSGPGQSEGSADQPTMHGTSDEITFTAPGAHSLGGIMFRYRLYLSREAGSQSLQIASQPDDRSKAGSDQAESLVDDVADLRIDYLARESASGAWQSGWEGRADLPRLIRVKLHFTHGNNGDWPEFVVRPRIDAPVDCHFDLVSRRCR